MVDYLVLGGGLFSNPYVQQKVEEEFPYLKIRKLSGDKGKGHVAKGAVLTRLQARESFITSRPIISSKALVTWMSMTSSIKNSPLYDHLVKYTDPLNNVEYFYAAQWLVKKGDEASLKYANDIYEVASESSFVNARTRVIDSNTKAKFTETILTVNYNPGNADWAAFRAADNKLVDQSGNLIPGDILPDTITWSPLEIGVSVGDLPIKRIKDGLPYKVLHYSIQMQMREVGTKYWIKAWSPCTKGRKTMKVVFSDAVERQTLFGLHEIERSSNLSESRRLASGMRIEDDPSEESELPVDSQQTKHQISTPDHILPSSTLMEWSSAQAQMPGPASSSVSRTTIEAPMSEPHLRQPQPQPSSPSTENKSSPTIAPNKRSVTGQDAAHSRIISRSPLQDSKKPQQQHIEGSSKSLGSPRKNGGCWTCALRNLKCGKVKPTCLECAKVGIKCEYGLPSWWKGESLRKQQKKINKSLIKEYKARERLRKQPKQPIKLSRSVAQAPEVSFSPVTQIPDSVVPVGPEVKALQSQCFPPVIPPSPNLQPSQFPSARLYEDTHTVICQPRPSAIERIDDMGNELYGASPRGQQPTWNADEDFWENEERRSKRRRTHYIPDSMKNWDDIDEEEFGLQPESESEASESHEDYIDEDD